MSVSRPLLCGFVALILPAAALGSPGSSADFRFKRYSLEQGLSQGAVHAIEQDQRGFLWVGTKDGLNRFNGHEFTILNHDPFDTTSLSSNRVSSLHADREGNLWVGTARGLNLLKPGGEGFTRYLHDPSRKQSLAHNKITCIHRDSRGVLWVGTDEGLDWLVPRTGRFIHQRHDPDDERSLCGDTILDLYENPEGTVWVATRGGLNRFDRGAGLFDRFIPDPASSDGARNTITAIADAYDGTLWLGTGAGVLVLDVATGGFRNVDLKDKSGRQLGRTKGRPHVTDVLVDASGNIWVGCPGGIIVLDPESGGVVHLTHEHGDPQSLSHSFISRLFQDQSEVVWAGTNGYGLNSWSPYLCKFERYGYSADGSNGLSFRSVRAVYEDPSGIVWVGGYGGGLNRIDPATRKFTRTDGVPGGIVYTVLGDPDTPDQVLWIGTEGSGMLRYDVGSKRVSSYPLESTDGKGLAGRYVYAMCADSMGRLWIGTERGVNTFDRASGELSTPRGLPGGARTRAIYRDESGAMWVGFAGGLARIDPSVDDFVRYTHDPSDPSSLSAADVLCVLEDSRGTIWVGTNGGGLNRLSRSEGTFIHYLQRDGLPNNVVCGILEGGDGHLWISTNAGISRFDPHSETFHNYALDDGLQSLEFNANAHHLGASGKLYFGGISGLNVIDPENTRKDPYAPPVVLTGLLLSNRPVTPSEEVDGRRLLERPISETDRLELSHSDNIVSFELAALNLAAPSRNSFAYKLEGFNDDWINIGGRRYITFTDLKPGKYRLLVKAANSDGVWCHKAASLKLVISPPTWQTWWFRCLALIALGAAAMGLYRMRTRAYERRGAELNRSREFLNSIINALDDPVIVKDQSSRWVVLNDKACDMLARTREELLGKKDYDVFSREQADQFRKEDEEAFAKGGTVIDEDVINGKGEARIIVTKKSAFTEDATGERFIAWSVRDMTGLKNYEKALEERLRFESLVSRISKQLINPPARDIDKVIETGLKEIGQFFAADRVVIRLMKAERDLPSKVYAWRADASSRSQVKEDFEAAFPNLASELSSDHEVVFESISDFPTSWKPEHEHMAAIGIRSGVVVPLSVGGALLGSISVLMVGTERSWPENTTSRVRILGETLANALHRKRANEALRQSQQKYWSILENIGIGIALISSEPRVLELNKKMRQWLPELDGDEIPFCRRTREDAPEEHDCPDCPIAQALNDGQVHEAISTTSRGGSAATFRVVTSPIKNSGGDVVAAIELVEDVTEKRRLEDQLRHSQKMEAIGTLAGGIAHDFNNILYAMLGYANLARRDLPRGTEAYDYLKQIEDAGQRAAELVEQILAFSRRSDNGKRSVRLQGLIGEALKLLRGSLPTTVQISQDIASDCGPVLANHTQIHQVLMNLCTNASQAMPDQKGLLHIGLGQVESDDFLASQGLDEGRCTYAKLSVSDDGVGIAPEIVKRIFEPYFTTKAQGKGSGLGLAMVHGIVSSHQGTIDVESKPGRGTTFAVYLPVCSDAVEARDSSLVAGDGASTSARILLVDDESIIADMSERILKKLGHRVSTFTDSMKAAETFRAHPYDYDLILTDVTMPRLTGIELADEVRAVREDIPIVLCTGYSESLEQDSLKEINIFKCIWKPVEFDELGRIIQEALSSTETAKL